jgi:glycosyltransferase involved in cell wall biosynthesis
VLKSVRVGFSTIFTAAIDSTSMPILRHHIICGLMGNWPQWASENGSHLRRQIVIQLGFELMPFISVVIPTYRRLSLLRNAIESVFAQTFTDWELVVSDDETPPGETWNYLRALAKSDARVRPIMNDGPHGACSNHNNALKAARGDWIKILHDDDVLKPNCLEVLAHAVRECPDVIAVVCACENFKNGKLADPFYRRDRAILERMESGDALLAMYILDEAGWAPPTQQMVHRSIVDAGILFEEPPGISALNDSWFNARVRAQGSTLICNLPLVEWHQGQHDTATSLATDEQYTAEFLAFRRLVFSLVPKDRKPPSLKSAEGLTSLLRAITLIRKRRVKDAICIIQRVREPHAYKMAIAWFLRQYYPRRFSSITRAIIWKNESDMRLPYRYTRS